MVARVGQQIGLLEIALEKLVPRARKRAMFGKGQAPFRAESSHLAPS